MFSQIEKMERIHEKLYYSSERGYFSLRKLYSDAKKLERNIKIKFVKSWLEKQPTYTLHKPARRHYPRNKVLVSAIDEQYHLTEYVINIPTVSSS
jgi:hypothetical protein